MFLARAYLKIFVFTIARTFGFFELIGYPGFLAYLTTLAETGAGVLLILGLHARWVALATVPSLLGAAQVHRGSGWVFSAQGGGWEYRVFLAVAAVVQGSVGNGSHGLHFSRKNYLRFSKA